MTKLRIHNLLGVCLAMSLVAAFADEARRLPTVGHAVPVDAATDVPYSAALMEGLHQLGYVEGKNILVITRYADGDPVKLRANIKELIDLRVDVLVGSAGSLKGMTTTIPIVSPTMGDPVRTGLVASLARPGGNLTGLSAQ